MARQYSVTYDSYDNWKIPLNLAIGFHVLVAVSFVFIPGLLKQKPRFEDIYTVNLVSIGEPASEPAATEPAASPPAPEPEPELEAVSVTAPEPNPVAPKEVKAVSLKPLKRKIKKQLIPEPEPNRQAELEKIRRERIAEALRAEQLAAEQARQAAEEAARQQRLLEQQLAEVRSQVRSTPRGTSSSGGNSGSAASALDAQYYNAIMNHVSRFWMLPDLKSWDDGLLAVVVITIGSNGRIVNQFFEQRSGDATFDQFVRKALQEANPLPAIPPALRKNSMEVGLRFKPGSIQ